MSERAQELKDGALTAMLFRNDSSHPLVFHFEGNTLVATDAAPPGPQPDTCGAKACARPDCGHYECQHVEYIGGAYEGTCRHCLCPEFVAPASLSPVEPTPEPPRGKRCDTCGEPATREFCYAADPWVPYCQRHQPQYATVGERALTVSLPLPSVEPAPPTPAPCVWRMTNGPLGNWVTPSCIAESIPAPWGAERAVTCYLCGSALRITL